MNDPSVPGWINEALSEIANVTLGKTPKRTDYTSNGSHRVIKYRDIRDNELVLDEMKDGFARSDPELIRSLREVHLGDILVGASGHSSETIGRKVAIVRELPAGGPHYFAGELLRIRPDRQKLDSRWAQHYFSSERGFQALQDAVSGVHLTNGRARKIIIPLPPIVEQMELCDLLDAVTAASSSACRHLALARRSIEQLQQAVIADACSGRLTAGWRARNACDSATKLLEGIDHRRESALGNRSKKAAAAAGYKFEVPEGWAVASLDRLSVRITSGSRDWSRFYGRGSGTFVMAQNVRPGYLDWSFRQSVNPPEHDASRERSQIAAGDLLVTIVGANTGDVGPVTEDRPEHYVCQSVALVRPVRAEVAPFLNLWFNSPEHGRGYFEEYIYGAGRPHLSFDQLKAAPVAVPPLDEQKEIMRRVDQLLRLAEGLHHRINMASRRVEFASQAVLAKTFRGELISKTNAETVA